MRKIVTIVLALLMMIVSANLTYAEEVTVGEAPIEVVDEVQEEWEPIGKFKLSFYCSCRQCSGKWGHQTSSGTYATEGRTVAVSRKILKPGTEIMIDGYGYRVVEDTGVTGRHINIFMESHSECLKNGIKYAQVYRKKK